MIPTDDKITRYADGDFLIDVVETATEYRAWIGHKSYGCADLMFGATKENLNSYYENLNSYEAFLDVVQNNLKEYEKQYADEHFEN